MKILIIAGSPRKKSFTNVIAKFSYEYAKDKDVEVDFLDLSKTILDSFRGYGEKYSKETVNIIESLKSYDLFLIATPVYDCNFSSALKNIFEHSNYKSLKGKVSGFMIMSGSKNALLLVHNQLNAMMNYFNIFSLPRAVYVSGEDFEGMELKSEVVKERVKDLVDSSIEITKKLSA